MIEQGPLLPAKKKHLWSYLSVLFILGLAVYLLLPQINTVEDSWSMVEHFTWWAVILAGVAEIISWIGNGIVLYAILDSNNQKLSIWKGTLIAIATLSISLAAGGWVGLAATYKWVHHESRDGNTAILAGTLPSFLNNGVLVVMSIIGTFLLLLQHVLTKFQLIEFTVIFVILGGFTAIVLIAVNRNQQTTRFAVWATRFWARLRHKPFSEAETVTIMAQFFLAVDSLRQGKWLRPLVGAVINVGFDMLAMYFLFIAAGNRVSLGVLFSGYGLPLVLGKMAFIFPGGIGVIERSMAALFVKLKVPTLVSNVVVLGYRLFSFWMPAILGFAAAAYLSGRLFHVKKVPS